MTAGREDMADSIDGSGRSAGRDPNVFGELGLADAGLLKVRAELMRALQHWLKAAGLTDEAAAHRLGVGRDLVKCVRRGHIDRITADTLVALLFAAGMRVSARVIWPRV